MPVEPDRPADLTNKSGYGIEGGSGQPPMSKEEDLLRDIARFQLNRELDSLLEDKP